MITEKGTKVCRPCNGLGKQPQKKRVENFPELKKVEKLYDCLYCKGTGRRVR